MADTPIYGDDVDGVDITPDKVTVPTGSGLYWDDGSANIYESSNNLIKIQLQSTDKFKIATTNGGQFSSQVSTGGGFFNRAASGTQTTIVPANTDDDSGLGWVTLDQPCMIAGGVNAVTWIENGGVLVLSQITAGITAHVGSSQGDGPLTSSYNEISVCANAGDAVTLPSAVAGYKVIIINNGANACDVFPATDDNIGAGADTAVSLAAGANITYLAYDVVNWATVA